MWQTDSSFFIIIATTGDWKLLTSCIVTIVVVVERVVLLIWRPCNTGALWKWAYMHLFVGFFLLWYGRRAPQYRCFFKESLHVSCMLEKFSYFDKICQTAFVCFPSIVLKSFGQIEVSPLLFCRGNHLQEVSLSLFVHRLQLQHRKYMLLKENYQSESCMNAILYEESRPWRKPI